MTTKTMWGTVVPRDAFPKGRKTQCCKKPCKRGESVIVIPAHGSNGTLITHVILHRRCVAALIRGLPLDALDYESRFETLRQHIIETGDPFPKLDSKGKPMKR